MMDIEMVVTKLKTKGVGFAEGLSEKELQHIETINNFRFPPDLRTFLNYALPVSDSGGGRQGFPNWRENPQAVFEERQKFLLSSIQFDVEFNNVWLSNWGEKPDALSDALAFVEEKFKAAPTLIPVFAHRFIPSEPSLPGNPVFSIWQTDIICYGVDLEKYLFHEFIPQEVDPSVMNYTPNPSTPIPFWDDLYWFNNSPYMNNE
jgi:hypothetical protein